MYQSIISIFYSCSTADVVCLWIDVTIETIIETGSRARYVTHETAEK